MDLKPITEEKKIFLKVLVVDDDRGILSVLESLLLEEGHRVTPCHDGLDAIKKCQEEKFDLILSDLMMPGAGGMEVLTECRKIYPDTLVILITGFASLETAVNAIRKGAYDYITKPFKLDEIKIIVNNAGEKIRLLRENKRLFKELQEAYNQLNIMKKILSSGRERAADEECQDADVNETLIAGSMLPHYYLQNNPEVATSLISELERLSRLKEKSFLSIEEFDLCKLKLLRNLKH